MVSTTASPESDINDRITAKDITPSDRLSPSNSKLIDPDIKRINIVLCRPNLSDNPPIKGPKTNFTSILNESKNPVKEAIPTLFPSKLIPSEPRDSMRNNESVDAIKLPRNNLVNVTPTPILRISLSPTRVRISKPV